MTRTPERVKTVYVVEDDAGLRTLLERVLGTFYSLRLFDNGREALNALQALPPDVLVTDLQMPGLSGEELLWAVGHLESAAAAGGDVRRQVAPAPGRPVGAGHRAQALRGSRPSSGRSRATRPTMN